ncbi:MAG: RNA 2',3'-cyclic phosphodiesterase [Bacteroidales bacterium]|nr:RNA 2',3'-cyclic phosphodiesterase [Bacteroidales bacterium]
MKRLFVAIPIKPDPALIKLVDSLKSGLRYDKISWVNTAQLHLTLKFIGETNESIDVFTAAMQAASYGIKAFDLEFDKTGIFGSAYKPRVIWIGSQQQNIMLNRLGENMLNEMDAIGFKRDRQNFVPHLTLGRIREIINKPNFQQIIKSQPQQVFQKTEVSKIVLYESILQHNGPLYKELGIVELK